MASVYDERSAQANSMGREVKSLEDRLDMAKQALSQKTTSLAEVEKTKEDVSRNQDREEMAKELKSMQIQLRQKAKQVNDLNKKKSVLATRLDNIVGPKVEAVRKAIVDNKNLMAETQSKVIQAFFPNQGKHSWVVISAENLDFKQKTFFNPSVFQEENLSEMLTKVKNMRLEKIASVNELDTDLDKLIESMLSWETKKENCTKKRDAAKEAMEVTTSSELKNRANNSCLCFFVDT